MRYMSVCSGIEAATVAWHPLGWEPVSFSEIEPFPCKVLAHHYQAVPNLGDMTKFKEWPDYADVDLLVGGTPCQSFSIAGLRKGLADPRGNLMLTYLAIAAKYRPTWLVWENVPGVLSSNGGKDFGTFLAGLGECGYGFAYRVLDAQYCRTDGYPYAVPQRRRRVFVVGHIGSWQRAAAVLFDSESLCGNPAPRREAGKDVAGTISKCSFSGGAGGRPEGGAGHHFLPVAPTLDAHYGDKMWLDNQHINAGGGCSSVSKTLITKTRLDAETETLIPTIGGGFDVTYGIPGNWIGRSPSNGGNAVEPMLNVSPCQTKTDKHAVAYPINTQVAMRHEALGEGTGLGIGAEGDASYTLQAAHSHAVAFSVKDDGRGAGDISPTVCNQHTGIGIAQHMQVRRLTPTECARLQGFPDDYLPQVTGYSDSAAYKALGNSMACNVMQLIGQRIQMVSEIPQVQEIAA